MSGSRSTEEVRMVEGFHGTCDGSYLPWKYFHLSKTLEAFQPNQLSINLFDPCNWAARVSSHSIFLYDGYKAPSFTHSSSLGISTSPSHFFVSLVTLSYWFSECSHHPYWTSVHYISPVPYNDLYLVLLTWPSSTPTSPGTHSAEGQLWWNDLHPQSKQIK